MTVYLLDTGIILGFQKAKHLDALTGASIQVSLAVVEDVYDEVVTNVPSKYRALATEAKELFDRSRVAVHELKIATPVAATHQAIRSGKGSATADLGESASIAWAIHHEEVVFVTNDPAASLRALQELRGRTMSFHPFLATLVENRALTVERCRFVARDIQTVKDWFAREPIWWATWLSRVESSS